MYLSELARSSLRAQKLYHLTWRRYRFYLTTVFALLLLVTIWSHSDIGVYDDFPTVFYTNKISQTCLDSGETESKWAKQHSFVNHSQLIAPKIWQIILPKKLDDVPQPEAIESTASWLTLNTDYA